MNNYLRQFSRVLSPILVTLLLTPFMLNAQVNAIKGTVVDSKTGEGIIGAIIKVAGTNSGAVTDETGAFSIANQKIPVDLEISYIGYENQTISVKSLTPIRVALLEITNEFDELLVVGYGRQKKKVSTGSVGKLEAKQLEGIALPDVSSFNRGIYVVEVLTDNKKSVKKLIIN